MVEIFSLIGEAKDLHLLKKGVHAIKKWKSIPASVVLADSSGNIGYMLLSASPIRGNEYPYMGLSVLDGTTTKHDWIDLVDIKDLPYVMNPKKGYFMTANHRIVPENSKFDIGGF